ncbi:WD40 repeat domain-containing protein [Aeromonas sobria]|uniref:WD40 repeat domain-containing protein n=1 Tax=Aeromonas sobria TaxID=646 RepID=UPI000C6E3CD6|nr:hypothetical protein [Aeromonas sobria]PKQ71374.1 hypothetical protein CJF47_20705 [Aeromonas sobria]
MYHQSPISGVAANQDFIATAGYDNRVILWRGENSPIAVGFHDHLANQVTFSSDGLLLASSSSDYSVRIWSLPNLQLLTILLHDDDVEGLSFSPCSKQIATASRDRKVRVFNINGEIENTFSGHANDAISVEWVDDNTILSCGDDGTLRFWDTRFENCIKCVDLGGKEVDTICITESKYIFSGDDDGVITQYNLDGVINKSYRAHQSGIKKLVASKKNIVSLSYDRTFKVWAFHDDVLTLTSEGTIPAIVWARSCAFVDSENIVFATFGDRCAKYSIRNSSWSIEEIKDTNSINSLYPSSDGLFTVGDAGVVKLDGKTINNISSLCNFILKNNDVVICGGQEGKLFNALNGDVIYQHHSPLNCVCFMPKLDRYLVGSYTGELIVVSFENDRYHATTFKAHSNAIKGVSINGNLVMTVCADHSVKIFTMDRNYCFDLLAEGKHEKIVNGCSAFRGGFISAGRDRKLNIWSDNSLEVIPTPHSNSIKCVASDGIHYIALGDYRGCVSLFNYTERLWTMKKISIHGVSSIAYDSFSGYFIAGTYDGSAHTLESLTHMEKKVVNHG